MAKNLRFTPGDTNYRWDFSENSPFLKRSQTLIQKAIKSKAKNLAIKKKYYDLMFSNEKDTYLSRNFTVLQKERLKPEKSFVKQHELVGSTVQINFSMNKLLERVIDKFIENPQSLFDEASKIRVLCLEEQFEIPQIEAFNRIKDWDEFIQLLESLNESNSTFKFELMIAAITRYSELCGG